MKKMLNRLQGIFESFRKFDVHYVVIGGIAAVLHGVPRATFDLDLLIEASPENGENLLSALHDAGLGTATLISPHDLLKNEITVFKDFVRIDVQTSTPGLEFSEAWARRVRMGYGGTEFYVLALEDLIASKTASGRKVDLEDVRLLTIKRESKKME